MRARSAAPARERGRRRVVVLLFIVFILAVLEGALRKYAFPSLGRELFFIRDPFLITAYLLAFQHRLWPRRSNWLLAIALMMVLGLLLALLQLALNGFDMTYVLLAGYGWRNYFLYAPLPFLMEQVLQPKDAARLYRVMIVLLVPTTILVAVQFASPPLSPINVGFGASEELQFRGLGVDPEHTRPMGFFTSPTGQSVFVATAFCICLGLLVAKKAQRPIGLPWALVGAAAVLSCLALGQSRGAVAASAIGVLGSVAFAFVASRRASRFKAGVLPLVLCALALAAYPILFPESFAVFSQRITSAQIAETSGGGGGFLGRAFEGFTGFFGLLGTTPVLGYGLGLGGNASTILQVKIDGMVALAFAEGDWSRHIVDLGPVFGVGFIIFRLIFSAWLTLRVVRHSRLHGNPMPMCLYASVIVSMVYGQITGHGTVNVFTWYFVGVCLAASRTVPQPVGRTAAQGRRTRLRHATPATPVSAAARDATPGDSRT